MPKVTKNSKRLPLGASIHVSTAIAGGSGKIKKKIRDIERLLKRDTIPANIRIDNERALKALHVELENAQHNLKTRENAKKYHMVRFFERKKATRRLKHAHSSLQQAELESPDDCKLARERVRQCEIDLAYILLFPKSDKYISLYPADAAKTPGEARSDATCVKRLRFRLEVQEMIENKKLPFSFDDILLGKSISIDSIERTAPAREIDAPEIDATNVHDDFFE